MKTLLVEYDTGVSLDHLISYGIQMTDLLKSVESANDRVSNTLKINRNVLSISDGKVKATGVAGVIRLATNIELEIIPKFISSKSSVEWRATLYLLSALSKHGSVMINERIKSTSTYSDSLYDMAGRMLAEEYLQNKRKPIRKYRKEKYVDYGIDGEVDFESYFDMNPNGFHQSQIRFDKQNQYNATIQKAMRIVEPYVSDDRARNIMRTAIIDFGKQNARVTSKQKLSSRDKEWSRAYDLSYDIIQGLGTSFADGDFYAPGFIANTWQMWEWLVTTAITIGSNNKKVISQKPVVWGTKKTNNKEYSVNVFPDVTVYNNEDLSVPVYLADAKYKMIVNEATGEVERADIYEAFAFCNSLSVKNIFLIYPRESNLGEPSGSVELRSTYYVSDVKIYIIQVAFGTIEERGGIHKFSQNLVKGIEHILNYKNEN